MLLRTQSMSLGIVNKLKKFAVDRDAGIAGIVRDHMGNWVLGFQQKCYIHSVLMGELQDICTALQIIEERRWSRVIINSDSQQAINRILQVDEIKDANFWIVKKCRDLCTRMTDIRLEFEARKTNRVADRLAKLCRTDVMSDYNLCIIEQAPKSVSEVLMEDRPP
ncbi:uncharacterized protein [Spinacia oleracea]|uniref:RNase H type-1 domain-containing protein n=1 Tax=Spinacia oleracea TaxID=3562 RepID=A0ABM3RHW8_SPIOL|nr:uncharacterized protein LOC130469765 [Spinacia oleracea]